MRESSGWLLLCSFCLLGGEGHFAVQAILQFPVAGCRSVSFQLVDVLPSRRRLAHAAADRTAVSSQQKTTSTTAARGESSVCCLFSARAESSTTTATTTTEETTAVAAAAALGGGVVGAGLGPFSDLLASGLLRLASATMAITSSNTSAFGPNNRALVAWYQQPPLPLWFPPSSPTGNNDKKKPLGQRKTLAAPNFMRSSPSASLETNNDNEQRWHKKLLKSPVHWLRAAHSNLGQAENHAFFRSMATATEDFTRTAPSTNGSTNGDSVHLKLNPHEPTRDDSTNNNNNKENNNGNNKKLPTTTLKVLTYVHPRTGQTWKAINTVKRKFLAFLEYNNVVHASESPVIVSIEHTFTQNSRSDQLQQERLRTEWRKLWKQRRLLADRTEFLAVYPSDETSNLKKRTKRGGFADLLHLYRERLVAILEDERNDSSRHALVLWLQDHYGPEATNRLRANNLKQLSEPEQLAQLKDFLEWFRAYFPYFYDKCGVCGASIKEDYAKNQHDNSPFILRNDDGEEEEEKGYQTFLGYVYPGEGELKGKASRTELYQCHKCHSYTRFPRYNSAWHVMDSRRGRCGEYSMLLYRFLRALDHETRWVVDWADHVWAEVYLPTSMPRWVHLDPCEAAVDENLIYQGWGKKQTYILGFYAPRPGGDERYHTPIIQDVTSSYTSDNIATIQQRREETQSQIHAAIVDSSEQLSIKLAKMESSPGLPLEPWRRPL